MTDATRAVAQNRQRFLAALRSGTYLKGPIETDARGRPCDPSQPGWCAVGLAYTLFHDPVRPGSLRPVRAALGCGQADFFHLQSVWNDSPLTFAEIAEKLATEWGWGGTDD
jgi:hypothetical protein